MIADPQGAVLAMIKPLGPEMPWLDEERDGHIVWNECFATAELNETASR